LDTPRIVLLIPSMRNRHYLSIRYVSTRVSIKSDIQYNVRITFLVQQTKERLYAA
jgi:hypothetical protein